MATGEYREAVALALKHGWYEVKTNGGHHVFEHVDSPNPVRFTISENLTDNGRAYKNVLAGIRKYPESLDVLDTWPSPWASAITFAQVLGWRASLEPNGGVRLRIPGGKSLLVRRPDRRKREEAHIKEANDWLEQTLRPKTPDEYRRAMSTRLALEGVAGVMDTLADEYVPVEAPKVERREHVKPERRLVSEEPWMAARSIGPDGAHLYPSEAVFQREWSDGSIDYVCAQDGCGWESGNARSVASHFAGAHSRGKGKQPQHEVVAVDPDRSYTPTQRLVDALAEWLTSQSWDSTDELAVLALQWAHDRPDLDPERPGRGPLHREPEGETLAKIRALLGEDPRLAEAEAERDRWKAEAQESAAALARVQSDLSALQEMVASIGRSA
jgi:hypothetical protein